MKYNLMKWAEKQLPIKRKGGCYPMFKGADKVLNQTGDAHLEKAAEDLSASLREAIGDLQAQFFDLEAGHVNYRAMKGSPEYEAYLQKTGLLRNFDLGQLKERHEKLAFWINLYNTMVIHGVIDWDIRESVKERNGFFTRLKYDIGGYLFSLNDIEHGILRGNSRPPHGVFRPFGQADPRFAFIVAPMDPRIHFTLVCGSRSCPPIGFYTSERIEEQLELAAASFVNSPEVEIIFSKNLLSTSQIFRWYRKDFGGNRRAIIQFLLRYLDAGEKKDFLESHKDSVIVRYREYDWSLNH
ncbi:MAG: DUF547 domain-containing protein [Syntrophobacterales bacterium]|nr:MAG: DUF547 domain-containing protein [Syntrophobacterales bacterium]